MRRLPTISWGNPRTRFKRVDKAAGDLQVPEGIYAIESLNPNSRFHLALRLNYPNADDRQRGARDGRTSLGGDIMIHGSRVSIGCIAVGDEAIEELFVLAADSGWSRAKVVLAPLDLRTRAVPKDLLNRAPWSRDLYLAIHHELAGLDVPDERATRSVLPGP